LAKTILIAALVALAGSAGARAEVCDRFAVEVATNPVPYQYPHGLSKAYALLGQVPDKADTILIGDSLVANWPRDMAARQFKSGPVWNFAVGGSVSQNTLWQLGKLKADSLKPARIVVLIGTNNLTHDYMPACAIAEGIKQVALSTHRKWPESTVQLIGIPPRGTNFHFRDDVRMDVNREIKAWSRDFSFLDYFEVNASEITCGQYDKPIVVATAVAQPVPGCANYADDFGHFKRAGYEVIFKAMAN
jgi:hypothetical protein